MLWKKGLKKCMNVTIRDKKGLIVAHYTEVIRVVCALNGNLFFYFKESNVLVSKKDYGWYETE